MSISEFKKYRNAKDKAQERASRLTAYVKENTRHIDWPQGLSPDEMEGQITQVFYESEKDALDRVNNSLDREFRCAINDMAGHVRHMMKQGARTMAAMAVLWPAGIALAKTPANEACTDPLKCFSHEKPVTPQNVYKNLTYERTVDGDTFVAGGKTIRVWGIDAPERGDLVFLASKMYMEVLLESARELRCKFIDVDRYGRDVLHCQADGLDIGSLMVQMGMARDYRNYSGGYYAEEERWAREAGAGIWKDR